MVKINEHSFGLHTGERIGRKVETKQENKSIMNCIRNMKPKTMMIVVLILTICIVMGIAL